jgi:hypothetical protein
MIEGTLIPMYLLSLGFCWCKFPLRGSLITGELMYLLSYPPVIRLSLRGNLQQKLNDRRYCNPPVIRLPLRGNLQQKPNELGFCWCKFPLRGSLITGELMYLLSLSFCCKFPLRDSLITGGLMYKLTPTET